MITIKLQSNFTEILLQRGCFPVSLLNIFRTSFPKNISGGLLLNEIVSFDLFKLIHESFICFDKKSFQEKKFGMVFVNSKTETKLLIGFG